jgi:L-cysteine S-thiosulfotransferase
VPAASGEEGDVAMRFARVLLWLSSALVLVVVSATRDAALGQGPPASPRAVDPAPHGTPAGWRLHWPAGDPSKGRAVFERLECFSCHAVRGERFPAARGTDAAGPELAAMGPRHGADYFVEAIVNPSAVIEPSRGYAAPDGSSKMPTYNDVLTVQELIDLVAYLTSLRPPSGSSGEAEDGHGAHH